MSLEDRLAAAEKAIAQLTHQVGLQQDIEAIRRLQVSYCYFMDKGLYDEAVDCFAREGELHFMGGIWRGHEALRRLYCGRLRNSFTHGVNGPAFGLMCEHWPSQDVISVADDRQTAKGRWRCTLMGAQHDAKPDPNPRLPRQWWEHGMYENLYVKEDGIWKLDRHAYHLFTQVDYETGWAGAKRIPSPFLTQTFPDDPNGPDEIQGEPHPAWPETRLVPFHYAHPVTGKEIVPELRESAPLPRL
jgi:carotenoid cleavage dioxygenase